MIRLLALAAVLAAGLASPAFAQVADVVPVCGAASGVLTATGPGGHLTRDQNGNLCMAPQPFAVSPTSTITLTVGPTATPAGALALAPANKFPVGSVTSYRIRNSAASASPVAWILTTSNTTAATLGTAYTTSGTGGTLGDALIDPNNTEYIGLTVAQQTALAAGTLYLSAVTPASGSATLSITPGSGL